MFKKLLACSACLAALAAPAAAADFDQAAQGSWYLRGDAGIGLIDESIWTDEITFAFGVGVGYRYNPNFRADLTFDAAIDYEASFAGVDASLDTYSVMANGYWDIPMGTFKPYLGIGAGYGWVDASAGGFSASDDAFVLGGMAGLAISMSHSSEFEIGYKYRRFFANGGDAEDHLFRAGIRWYFN